MQDFSFYNSIDFWISGKQIIVYPDRDAIDSYKNYTYEDMENELEEIIRKDQAFFEDMDYSISFIWNYKSSRMIDFWKFNANYVDDRSGPLADVRIYKNDRICRDLGAASGNTLLVLGIEEKLRRKSKNLISYLKGPAPKLPFQLQINQDFFNT